MVSLEIRLSFLLALSALARGKEKGPFPRTVNTDSYPQGCRESPVCSPIPVDTSRPWEHASPHSTDRETEAYRGTKSPTES